MKGYWLLIIFLAILLGCYLTKLFLSSIRKKEADNILKERIKINEIISGSPLKSCLAIPILFSQGLINDSALVCDAFKDIMAMPVIHFENASRDCRQNEYIFVNLDITDFKSLFQDPDSPRNILCKNFLTLETLKRKTPEDFNLFHTGFTSIDRFDDNIVKDYSKLIHIAGKSPFKGTEMLVKTWILHPEWPTLTIICREWISKKVRQNLNDNIQNIVVIDKYITENELNNYYNRYGIHICSSNHEGFGHNLNEARACQSVVLYTDGPPMNEMFKDGVSGLKINAIQNGFSKLGICPNFVFKEKDLEETITKLLSLNDHQKRNMGINARQDFLKQKSEFQKNIKPIILGKTPIPKVIHTMWIAEKNPYDDSPYPDKYKEHIETWLDINPEINHLHWTGREVYNLICEHFPEYREFYKQIQPNICKCDFARFIVVAVYGGLYHDLDFYCIKNVSPLLQGETYFAMEPREHGLKLFNGFFGAAPYNSFVLGWISTMIDNILNGYISSLGVLKATGPEGLYKYYNTSKDRMLMGNTCDIMPYTGKRKLLNSCSSFDKPFAYTIWHDGTSWGKGKIHYNHKVHVLHPEKTGGLSIRKAIGCNCADGTDEHHGATEFGTAGCHKTTRKGRFICHGHGVKCRDISKNDPYVILVRDPEDRAKSWMKYFRRNIKSDKQFEKHDLYSYIDCPDNPPDMILHTETLDKDYQEFRRRFCPPGECTESISHYHDSRKDPSNFQIKFGPEEKKYVRKVWGKDYIFSKDLFPS
uniref:Glycosyltransferase n=1 Tax=Marseillevirus LCMAC101 TaxID=2506602 RepID=A0A481YQL1_9VIRU|nr:MAG: glycosyltransferase [Marseillevirus LCMAC101]